MSASASPPPSSHLARRPWVNWFFGGGKDAIPPEQYLRPLGQALTQLGWTIQAFTSTAEQSCPREPWILPQVQLTPLGRPSTAPSGAAANPAPEENWATPLLNHCQRQGGPPLIHTFGEAAAATGRMLQQRSGWRWIHSPSPYLPKWDYLQTRDDSQSIWCQAACPAGGHSPPGSQPGEVAPWTSPGADQWVHLSAVERRSFLGGLPRSPLDRRLARRHLGLPPVADHPWLLFDARTQPRESFPFLAASLWSYHRSSLDSSVSLPPLGCLVLLPAGEAPDSWQADWQQWQADWGCSASFPLVWCRADAGPWAYGAADIAVVSRAGTVWGQPVTQAIAQDCFVLAPDTPSNRLLVLPGVTGELFSTATQGLRDALLALGSRWAGLQAAATQPATTQSAATQSAATAGASLAGAERLWIKAAAHLSHCYRQQLSQHLSSQCNSASPGPQQFAQRDLTLVLPQQLGPSSPVESPLIASPRPASVPLDCAVTPPCSDLIMAKMA